MGKFLPLSMIVVGGVLIAAAVWNVKITDLFTGVLTPKTS